mgnify:CR=1 FL=1
MRRHPVLLKTEVFMKTKFYTIIFTAVIPVVFFSCKSASKLYQQGNYDEAVELAAKKLQKKPSDADLIQVIQSAYQYAVNDHESRIRTDAASSSELKYEWMYNEYAALQRLYDAIYHSPGVFEIVHPTDYSSSLITYAGKAGDVYYQRGLNRMDNGDKQSYRDAYYNFEKALFYRPGDAEISSLKQEAFEYAVTNVVVLPVEDYNNGFRFSSYTGQAASDFGNTLVRNLQYNTSNIFVRFYSSLEARSKNIIPDQVIDLHLNTVNLGRMTDNSKTREVTKEVVVKETVYRKDSVIKEYGKVKARITTTTRSLYADGSLQVSIRNGNGQWLWSDNIVGDYRWSTVFSTYTGDERALGEEDKKQVNTRPLYPPSDNDIMQCIAKDIQNNLYAKLRDYYNRY